MPRRQNDRMALIRRHRPASLKRLVRPTNTHTNTTSTSTTTPHRGHQHRARRARLKRLDPPRRQWQLHLHGRAVHAGAGAEEGRAVDRLVGEHFDREAAAAELEKGRSAALFEAGSGGEHGLIVVREWNGV